VVGSRQERSGGLAAPRARVVGQEDLRAGGLERGRKAPPGGVAKESGQPDRAAALVAFFLKPRASGPPFLKKWVGG